MQGLVFYPLRLVYNFVVNHFVPDDERAARVLNDLHDGIVYFVHGRGDNYIDDWPADRDPVL